MPTKVDILTFITLISFGFPVYANQPSISVANVKDSYQVAASVRVFESRVRKYQRKIARSKEGSSERKANEQRLNYNLGKLNTEYQIKLKSPTLSPAKRKLYLKKREDLIEYMTKRAEEKLEEERLSKDTKKANLQVSKPAIDTQQTQVTLKQNSAIETTKIE